jgi:DNA-binding NtrC family response regulator
VASSLPNSDPPGSIVVVDDEQTLLTLLTRTLNRAGYNVAGFLSAEAAAAQVNEPPDILVTDQQLPGMTGVELAVLWTSAWPKLRAIISSGLPVEVPNSPDGEPLRIRTLQKPFSPDDLLMAIADAINSAAAE